MYFFSTKLGADGFPVLPMQLEVEMADGSTFEGFIQELDSMIVPYWMQPYQENDSHYHVFIRTARNVHYISTIEPLKLVSRDPANHVPRKAELRIKSRKYDEHFAAKSFQLVPTSKEEIRYCFGNLPLNNRIYITRPKGRIFSAVLENHLSAGDVRKFSQSSIETSSKEYPNKRLKTEKN